MPKDFNELKKQLAQLKIWAVVAVLGTIGLVAFYGNEAKTYWEAHTQTEVMTYQLGQISQSLRGGAGPITSVNLANQTHRLQQINGLFEHAQTDDILATISATARLTRVTVGSVSAGDQSIEVTDEAKYVSQPMNLSLKGSTNDIYRYLFALHQQIPIMSVASFNLTNTTDGIGSSAEVSLVFLLSPQSISEDQGED